MQKTALTLSSLIFTFVAIGHFIRYFQGWDLIIGPYSASLDISLVAGIVTGLLAAFTFLGRRKI